ncbi:MAG TPA: cell envelope integrity protein CreD [Chitinophagaceae bacterium]|nr:cell envelope integrity protein CreD [Chitinophagaceae bacterium]
METVSNQVQDRSKLLIKALLIAGLIILLSIPSYFVRNLITEREARQQEAFEEVSSKWAGSQTITPAVLVLPYADTIINDKGEKQTFRKLAYVLPDSLQMDAIVKPEERHRGIYQVMLYSSQMKIKGRFGSIPLQQLKLDAGSILWNEAYVLFGITDVKGLKDEVHLQWNGRDLSMNPSIEDSGLFKEGFSTPVEITEAGNIDFTSTLNFNGSKQLAFTPVGKETTVKLSSTWPDPSFIGGQLPDYRINGEGFTATWRSLSQTHPFPQAWKENLVNLEASSFGTDLYIPVNGYQKTMRSVKYAMLCIVLTFAAFFIIETVNKRSVHPFQYGLIGLALILFYTLLLSISEYTGFNGAYVISSVATIALIAWFVKGVLQSGRLTSILGALLVLLYSYVFTILQLQDYSLLLGSIGLFLTLGVIMHFSKKVQW